MLVTQKIRFDGFSSSNVVEAVFHLYHGLQVANGATFRGDGIQLRYLVTATRNEPDFVIVGNGGCHIPNEGPSQRPQCVSSSITYFCFNWF